MMIESVYKIAFKIVITLRMSNIYSSYELLYFL